MGMFDFFLKKELQHIKELSCKLEDSIAKIKSKDGEIQNLSTIISDRDTKIIELQQQIKEQKQEYLALINEAESRILELRHKYEQYNGVVDAENEAKRLISEAITILENAKQEADGIKETASLIHFASLEAFNKTKKDAEIQALDIINNAKSEALILRNKASDILNQATTQASTIITAAEERAQEIAGDAYKAKEEASDLTKTITALKNTIKGYGDEYIIPTYSLLDELADNYGFTEAGEELKIARERTRLMVKSGMAAKCEYVEDYRRDTAINFTVDAFNGKVDTILSSVKQDNFGILKQKITDAYQLVNNLGKAFRNAVITRDYLYARIDELKWAVIVIELRNQEREEQRRIKEQIREEEKAKREYEKALKDAEKEEDTIKKALEKATKELEAASDEQKQKYEAKLAELNERLKIAEEKGQRALSMAQQTKSGHVYVISNVGSFGENVYKIGMTRRLEPEDRIKELGDASVPFPFDIHAMIYSNNAPSLETELHRCFVDNQLNKVNQRKEFFKVGLKNIRDKVESLNLQAKWTMISQAAEYRESLALEQEMNTNESKHKEWEDLQLRKLSFKNYTDEEIN